jgi:DNA-binding transcriptional MerR regulator
MSSTRTTPPKPQAPPARLLTIGTVCRRLKSEFPDISISKIRYLEDQGLLTPRRTQGGYRLFGEDDVERLRTILQLQRDEFLPLRVIRQELASPTAKERKRRRAAGLAGHEDEVDLGGLCERAGVPADLARELEDYGLLSPRVEGGERLYPESDVDIANACGKLSRFGIAPRHLRAFRTAADREAGLLEAVLAPALRSRNPERRQAAIEDLQTLGELAHEVSQLLFWRELRRQAAV